MGMFSHDEADQMQCLSCKERDELKAKHNAYVVQIKKAIQETKAIVNETAKDYGRIAKMQSELGDYDGAIEFHSKAYGLNEAMIVLLKSLHKHGVYLF